MADDAMATTDLVREAVADARELVRIELKLATDEVKTDLRQAQAAAIVFGAAAALTVVALTLFVVAIPLAFATPALAALVCGAICVVIAGGAALVGYYLLPKKLLSRTRKTATRGLTELKEAL